MGTVLIAILALLSVTGCSGTEPATNVAPAPDMSSEGEVEPGLTDLDGLVFVRDGALWIVDGGSEVAIAEGDELRAPAYSHARDAVTWISTDGDVAILTTAALTDLRPEPVWETEYSSMLEVAFHDDTEDEILFSVVGDASTMIARSKVGSDGDEPVAVSFEPSGYFTVDFDTGALYLTDAVQQPATVYHRDSAGTESALYSAAGLFSPTLTLSGDRLCVTGFSEAGGPIFLAVIDLPGGDARMIETPGLTPTDPAWSAGGDRIAFRDADSGTLWIANVTDSALTDTGITVNEGGLAW